MTKDEFKEFSEKMLDCEAHGRWIIVRGHARKS